MTGRSTRPRSSPGSIACSVAGEVEVARVKGGVRRHTWVGGREDHIHVNMLHPASSGDQACVRRPLARYSEQNPASSRYKPTNQSERSALPELPSSQLGNRSAWPTRNCSVSPSFLLSSVLVHHLNHLADTALLCSSRQGPGAPSRAPTSRSEGQVVCKEEDRLEEDCREHDDGERQ